MHILVSSNKKNVMDIHSNPNPQIITWFEILSSKYLLHSKDGKTIYLLPVLIKCNLHECVSLSLVKVSPERTVNKLIDRFSSSYLSRSLLYLISRNPLPYQLVIKWFKTYTVWCAIYEMLQIMQSNFFVHFFYMFFLLLCSNLPKIAQKTIAKNHRNFERGGKKCWVSLKIWRS